MCKTAMLTKTVQELVLWESIASEINGGFRNNIISVGDKISFSLKNGKEVTVVAVAKKPYWNNSMAFCFDNCISEHNMNDNNTNAGGWSNSGTRKYLNDEILPLLPDELIRVIKDRTIVQIIDGKRYESRDKIWLPSRTEVFGETAEYKDIDFGDVHFEFFNDERSRVKMFEGSTADWWERSPDCGDGHYSCIVGNDGSAGYSTAGYSCGVAPAFIV